MSNLQGNRQYQPILHVANFQLKHQQVLLQVPSWLAYQPSVFCINAYKFSGGSVSTYSDNTTLIQILTGMVDTVTQDLDLYGLDNINLNMVVVYLNALLDPIDGNITYPIIQMSNSFPFNSISNLANYLGNEAAARRLTTASQLAALVANPNQSLI